MARSPRDTDAQRATARRRVEDIVDAAVALDNSIGSDGEPVEPQIVCAWIPTGLYSKAAWDRTLRPVYTHPDVGWKTAEWGHSDEDDRDFVKLTT